VIRALVALGLAFALSTPAVAQLVATIGVRASVATINPATNRVYLAGNNAVAVVDGASNTVIAQVPVGRTPAFMAVNTATNRIYVSNVDDGTVSVIDGVSNAVTTLPVGGAGAIAVNERTNRIYVIRQGNAGEVAVIDGAAHTWYTLDTGSHDPRRLVVNPDTNRLYVSHGAGDVRVVDASSTSDRPPGISIAIPGSPSLVALNRATNKVYVSSNVAAAAVVEIDGATNAAAPIAMPGHAPFSVDLVVNPVSNRIFLSLQEEVAAIDGTSRAVSYVPTGSVGSLAVDTGHDRVYASANGDLAVLVIDGPTNGWSRIAMPGGTAGVAVNSTTHRIYALSADTYVLDGNAIATPSANYGVNLQGMWWNDPAGSESGWGLYVAHQANTVFAVWYTYDADGSPLWIVIPNAARVSDRTYRGDAYRTTGPSINAANFDPSAVQPTVVGNVFIALDATRDDFLIFSGTILGTSVHKVLVRHAFASPMPVCAAGGTPGAITNFTDMWWRPSESGWGLSVSHEGDLLFAVVYLYDEGGRTLWLVAPRLERTANASYSGTLYRTAGPPYTTMFWNNAQVSTVPVGTLSANFQDAGNGTLTFSYAGATRTKAITREVFASPQTVCR
jgi:YVTN family beta-propeller protein